MHVVSKRYLNLALLETMRISKSPTTVMTADGEVWSTNVVLWSHGETLSLDIETLPIVLMNYQWCREQKWNQVRVDTVSTRIFSRLM